MKRHALAAAVATILTVLAPSAFAGGGYSPARGTDLSYTVMRFDEGRKWSTDEALRRHMGEIRDLLALQRREIASRTLMPEEAQLLGLGIEASVASLLAQCRLAPEAAHNMHLVVRELVQAADILQGRATGSPIQGAGRALRAVQMYATYFDHPDWTPVL
jgi:hypothetical protein